MIPPNWEAYGGVGNGGKTWGILGLIFGGSPIDWMFKQIDPGDIRTLGAACQMFATNMDRTPSGGRASPSRPSPMRSVALTIGFR